MGWKFPDRMKYRAAYAANNIDIIPHLLSKPTHNRDDFGKKETEAASSKPAPAVQSDQWGRLGRLPHLTHY